MKLWLKDNGFAHYVNKVLKVGSSGTVMNVSLDKYGDRPFIMAFPNESVLAVEIYPGEKDDSNGLGDLWINYLTGPSINTPFIEENESN